MQHIPIYESRLDNRLYRKDHRIFQWRISNGEAVVVGIDFANNGNANKRRSSRVTFALHRPCTFNDGISVGKWRLALPPLVSESFRIELSFNEFRHGPFDANLAVITCRRMSYFFAADYCATRVSSRSIGLRVAKGSHVERHPATLPPYTGC